MERKQRRRMQIASVLAGLALYGLGMAAGAGRQDRTVLIRNPHGEGTALYEVTVNGLLERETEVTVPVGERTYTADEAERLFDEIEEELPKRILGENASIHQVRTDLELITQWDEYGIELQWETDGRLVDGLGKVYGDGVAPEGEQVELAAVLSDGSHERRCGIEITVLPPFLTGEELEVERFLEQVRAEDTAQGGDSLRLPGSFKGNVLSYYDPEGAPLWALPFFGIFTAVFLEVRERETKKQQKERRERELLRDYPEIVSKLTVFLGAGLTVRGAWEQIVRNYERDRKEGKGERYAYEEMRETLGQMEKKIPEGKAYQEFGRRCGLQPYLKLAGLLEQNRREGTKNLRSAMRLEMAAAFEERKNLARKQGEEAGTKLLIPLFLMLGVVMAMVAAPALLSF